MKDKFNRLRIGIESLEDLEKALSKKNRDTIKKFVKEHLEGLAHARIVKYQYALIRWAYLTERDFEYYILEAKKSEKALEKAEAEIRKANQIIFSSDMSDRTQQDIINEVKNFYKRMFGRNKIVPEPLDILKMPKIKTRLNLPKDSKDLPDEDMINRCIKACNNSRDKFLIALIGLDSGMRPCEARELKWSDISKDKYGYYAKIRTAKGSGDNSERIIRIINSEPHYVKWNQDYPKPKTDEDFVFINFQDFNQMKHNSFVVLFQSLKKKLQIKHKFTPYLLRHAFISRMIKNPKVSQATLKKLIGHSVKTHTINEYTHIGDEDSRDMMLEVNGLKKEKKIEEIKKPIECFKCKKKNEFDADFCIFCNMPLKDEILITQDNQLKGFDERLKRIEMMFIQSQQKQMEAHQLLDTQRNYKDVENLEIKKFFEKHKRKLSEKEMIEAQKIFLKLSKEDEALGDEGLRDCLIDNN